MGAAVVAPVDPDRHPRRIVLQDAKVRSIARALYIGPVPEVSAMTGRKTGKKPPKKYGESPKRAARRAAMREERRLEKKALEAEGRRALIDECVQRVGRPTDREAFREILTALVENNAIPANLLTTVPQRSTKAGKTRFDQIFDACMFLAFPEYRPIVRDKAFGPIASPDMRLWRALFPKEYGLSHVVLRARSFQEAFALACDYACRLSLREKHRIPTDMSIRVQFMADPHVARMLAIRNAVKDRTRKASNLRGRRYSAKAVVGARLVAIGRKEGNNYSIFKYAEDKDLKRIAELRAEVRVSAVEIETFRPKETPSPYDVP